MLLKITTLAALVVVAQLANSNPMASGFTSIEKHWCEPERYSNWTSNTEAKQKCHADNECDMFYDRCGKGEFHYCSIGAAIKYSECGSSTLYKLSKR